MDSNFINSHILCTKEEKRLCLDTADKLIRLAQTARCRGLLALENAVLNELYQTPPLIKIGVELIVDGTDPKIVSCILENYLMSSELSNQGFLDHMIVYHAIHYIQMGHNPKVLLECICSLFGLDFREEFLKFIHREKNYGETDDLVKLVNCKREAYEKTNLLDFIPVTMEDNGVQRVLREIPLYVLESAMLGSKQAVVDIFVRNLSKNNRHLFFEDLSVLHTIDNEVIINHQKEIISTIKKLEAGGEICLSSCSQMRLLTKEELDIVLQNNLEKG